MILYFSSTGNSKYVATKISLATGDSLVSIAKCNLEGTFEFPLEPGERVGVICPTYFSGIPSVVDDFLSKLKLVPSEGEPYVYVITTYGHAPGGSDRFVDDHLKKAGFKAHSRYTVKMPDNWIPDNDVNDKEAISAVNAAADEVIKDIVVKIKDKARGDFADGRMMMFTAKRNHKKYEEARKTSHLSVTDDCFGCKRCAKFCPTQAIKIIKRQPHWEHEKCAMCLGCVNRCPANAIVYDERTKDNGQYVHPGVKLSMGVRESGCKYCNPSSGCGLADR